MHPILKHANWMSMFPPVLLLVALAALAGLFGDHLYQSDSALMATKSQALDLVHLVLIIPVGLIIYLHARQGQVWAAVFLIGILVYLAFTYAIYALSIYVNELFLVYVALLGMCVFTSALGILDMSQIQNSPSKAVWTKVIATWLFFLAIGGYAAWLSEVIPSIIQGVAPPGIQTTGLPVSVVHVIDMAFMLPLLMIGAIKLWQGHVFGLVVCAVMLVFVLLIGISVIFMELTLYHAGIDMDMGKLISFCFTVPINFLMTIFAYRKLSETAFARSIN